MRCALKAYRVEYKGWPEVTSYYLAQSRSQARYFAAEAAYEAGYGPVRQHLQALRVTRAPQYDGCGPSRPSRRSSGGGCLGSDEYPPSPDAEVSP